MPPLDQEQLQKDLAIDDIHKHIVRTPYKEYPRHLYKGDKVVEVKDDAEKAKYLKQGYGLDAPHPEGSPLAEAAKESKLRGPSA